MHFDLQNNCVQVPNDRYDIEISSVNLPLRTIFLF